MRIEQASFDRDAWPKEVFLEYAGVTPSLFLVAKVDGRMAGYSIATLRGDRAEIDSLAVLPRYRNFGIATALLKLTMRKVRTNGAQSISLMVRRKNESAIRLYRKLGFVRVATVANYYPDRSSTDGSLAWRMRNAL